MTKIYEALEQSQKDRERKNREEGKGNLSAEGSESPPLSIAIEQTVAEMEKKARPQPSESRTPSKATYSARAERAMTGLCQRVASLLAGEAGATVEFLGVDRGEGASNVARQFAMVAAIKLGKSVLLLDADYERPSLLKDFGLTLRVGWQDGVAEGELPVDAAQRVGDSSLWVAELAPGGAMPPFGLPRIGEFFRALAERYDMVVIDAPSAGVSPDGIALADKVGGIVLVAESEKTRWQVADELKGKIEEQGGRILGVVLSNRRHIIPKWIYKRL